MTQGRFYHKNSGVEWELPHQPHHHRVHFLRSPKPEKYEKYEFHIISRVANSVMG